MIQYLCRPSVRYFWNCRAARSFIVQRYLLTTSFFSNHFLLVYPAGFPFEVGPGQSPLRSLALAAGSSIERDLASCLGDTPLLPPFKVALPFASLPVCSENLNSIYRRKPRVYPLWRWLKGITRVTDCSVFESVQRRQLVWNVESSYSLNIKWNKARRINVRFALKRVGMMTKNILVHRSVCIRLDLGTSVYLFS